MKIVKGNTFPALYSSIRSRRRNAADNTVMADVMSQLQPKLEPIIHDVSTIIAATRPLVVPMTWSLYPERLWDPNYNCVEPCITINQSHVGWSYTDSMWHSDDSMSEILKDSATIYAQCSPCWNTYKRWRWELIESFYTAMRVVKYAYDIDWRDDSTTQTRYEWEPLKYLYGSKKPIETIETRINDVKRYDEWLTHRETKVFLYFEFTLPNTPEKENSASNCHVVEEEITETITRKVKRMKCV